MVVDKIVTFRINNRRIITFAPVSATNPLKFANYFVAVSSGKFGDP